MHPGSASRCRGPRHLNLLRSNRLQSASLGCGYRIKMGALGLKPHKTDSLRYHSNWNWGGSHGVMSVKAPKAHWNASFPNPLSTQSSRASFKFAILAISESEIHIWRTYPWGRWCWDPRRKYPPCLSWYFLSSDSHIYSLIYHRRTYPSGQFRTMKSTFWLLGFFRSGRLRSSL